MPRRNRRDRRDDEERPLSPTLAVRAPAGWRAVAITEQRAIKEYRCPGCNQEIRPGVGHVAAWRVDDEQHRRHWHTGCWNTRLRTAP